MTRSLILTALVFLAGCGADVATAPDQPVAPIGPNLSESAEEDLVFLTNAPNAPPMATGSVSFWAVKGRETIASLWYHSATSGRDSTELVRFRLDRRSLWLRPDGTPFAEGDSVLITMSVADSSRLIVEFQPSGLRFDPKKPARLWFKWSECDPDVNHDGVVDGTDQYLLATSQIWRQEAPGLPWESMITSVSESAEMAEAKIDGFTRYAVAY